LNSLDDSDYEDDNFIDITYELKKHGLEDHLRSQICHKNQAQTKSTINRYARFLMWLAAKVNIRKTNVLLLINLLILEHFPYISEFYQHIKEDLQLSSSTVLTYNDEIQILIDWFVVYRICKDNYKVEQTELYGINLVLKRLRKLYLRERKREDIHKDCNTIESLTSVNKWPRGGFKELSDIVLAHMDWARRVCSTSRMDSYVSKIFMQLLAASFYTSKIFFNILYL
jgi:hypothetical protein